MAKKIKLRDGTGLIEDVLYFNIAKNLDKDIISSDSLSLRVYRPDWEKIIASETFLDAFHKRYSSGEYNKMAIPFFLEYYRNTQFDNEGKYLRRTLKRTRKFDIDSIEYKNFFKELIKDVKKAYPELDKSDLRLKIEFPHYNLTEVYKTIRELFNKAAYKRLDPPEQTPMGQFVYGQKYLKKIFNYYIHINASGNDQRQYTQSEIDGLKKYLAEDNVYEELRKTQFSKVLEKVKSLLSDFRYSFENGVIHIQKSATGKVVGYDKIQLEGVVTQALDLLQKFLKEKKDKEKRKKVNSWISAIQKRFALPEPDNWMTLVYINDQFTSKYKLIQQINIEIEMLYRRCYREWAKKAFHELILSKKLTKPEKRLFILMHIGTPYLDYRTPTFDPLLIKYFNFNNLTTYTFLLSSLFQVNKIEKIDLKLMNQFLFLSFLRFYDYWITHIQQIDVERKKDIEYSKRFKHDEYMERTEWEDRDLDLFKTKDKTSAADSTTYDKLDTELDIEENDNDVPVNVRTLEEFLSPEDERILLSYDTITVKKPGVNVIKAMNINLKEFFFRDILEKHCDPTEQKIFYDYYYNKETLAEIGVKLGISAPAVKKRIDLTRKRLSTIPELADILTEM